MAWDDAKKQKAIDMYVKQDPTPETSMEIVKEIAEKLEESPNGVRMILSKAEVYVKKEAAKGGEKKATEGKTTTRVSKEAAFEALREELEVAGATIEPDIIDKLTGKAAVYFTEVLKTLNKK